MSRFRLSMISAAAILTATAGSFLAYAATGKLSGDYITYSRGMGDPGPPTAKDTKVWMGISGPLALQMYQRLGQSAQLKEYCGDPDPKIRERGEISCMLLDNGKAVCNVNFDLRTGKVWGGTIC